MRARLAFLIALLFECAGLLPWICLGTHAPQRMPEEAMGEPWRPIPLLSMVTTPASMEATVEAPPPPVEIVLPTEESLVERWAKQGLMRRKGSFVPSGNCARISMPSVGARARTPRARRHSGAR